jgi:hypothetical protein
MKVQITGLPVSTFVPAGRWYFLQLSEREMAVGVPNTPDDTFANITYNGEAYAIAAVNAGKGFSLTSQELLNTPGGMHIPYLPPGPQSMSYTDFGTAYTWAGNAAPWAIAGPTPSSAQVNPSIHSMGTSLVVIGFGIPNDTTLTFSYAHHTEYTPVAGAAGIVDLQSADCSAQAREGISVISQRVSKQIHGATDVASLNVIKPSNRGRTGMLENIVDGLGRASKAVQSASPIVETILSAFLGSGSGVKF